MEKLWEYQQADMELDRFENKLKKSETRQQLLKTRNLLLDQQNRIKKLEQNLGNGVESFARIQKEYEKAEKEAEKIQAAYEASDKEDLNELGKYIRALDEINKLLNSLRRELQKINKVADGTENTVNDMRTKIAAGKKDFDALKARHDEELKGATAELEKLKAAAEKLEPSVEKDLMERYKKVKKSRTNPVAKVQNEQCGGCMMAIPSLTMRHLKEGKEIVQCESCGRILYYQE